MDIMDGERPARGAWMGSRRGFVLSGLATVLPVAKARALPPPLDWSVDSPDSQGISGAALEKVLDSGETVHGVRSLAVVRNGCRQDQRGADGIALVRHGRGAAANRKGRPPRRS